MSFSDETLGFYFQVEDRSSKTMAKAVSNYESAVETLEKLNKRVHKITTATVNDFHSMFAGLEDFPDRLGDLYGKAVKKIQAEMKPITQKVVLDVSGIATKQFSKLIQGAVFEALSKVQLRVSATMPLKKNSLFDSEKSLKAAYSTQIQPADMKGGFQVPKFATGGIVGGPGTPGGVDNVLAWLTKGEMVLPVDATKNLLDAYGQLLKNNGKYTKASIEFTKKADAFGFWTSEIENAMKGIDAARRAGEAGLDPNANLKIADGIKLINDNYTQMKMLVEQSDDEIKKVMLPHLAQMNAHLQSAKGSMIEVKDEATVLGKVLSRVFGPVQYLALNAAVNELYDSFGDLSHVYQRSFGDLEGGGTENFIKNINDANVSLNMTRAELRGFKSDVLDASKAWSQINPTQLGESVEALVNAGNTSVESIKRLAPITAQISAVTKQSADATAESLFQMTGQMNLAEDQAVRLFVNIKKYASESHGTIEAMIEGLKVAMKEAEPLISMLNPKAATEFLDSMSRATSALADVFGENAQELTTLFSKGLGGDMQSIEQLGAIGVDALELQQKVAAGISIDEDVSKAIRNIREQTRNFDPLALQQYSEAVGLSVNTVSRLRQENSKADETLQRLAEGAYKTSDAMGALNQASENTNTIFTSVRNVASNMFAAVGGEVVIDFFSELNPMALLSSAYLLKWGYDAVTAFSNAKKAAEAAKAAGAIGTVAQAASSVAPAATAATAVAGGAATAAGGAGAGAGGAGFLVGLSVGLTALSAPPVFVGIGALALLGTTVVGTAVGLAYAATVAVPAIKAVGGAVEGVLAQVAQMDADQIVALAGGMVVLGLSFTPMAASVFAGSSLLLASVPAITAFTVATGLMSGGKVGMAGLVEGLTTAFYVDPAEVRRTTDGMWATVDLFTSVSAASVALAAAVVIGASSNNVAWLASITSLQSPAGLMVSTATQAAGVAKQASDGISSVGFTEADADQSTKTLMAVGRFYEGYALTAESYGRVRASASWSSFTDGFSFLFTGRSGLSNIAVQMGEIRTTIAGVSDLSDGFDPDKLDDSAVAIQSIARFLKAYSDVVQSVGVIKTDARWATVGDAMTYLFTGNSPLAMVARQGKQIQVLLPSLVDTFGGMNFGGADTDAAANSLKEISGVLGPFADVLDAMNKLGTSARALEDGYIFDGNMTKVLDLLPGMRDNIPLIMNGIRLIAMEARGISSGEILDVNEYVVGSIKAYSALVESINALSDVSNKSLASAARVSKLDTGVIGAAVLNVMKATNAVANGVSVPVSITSSVNSNDLVPSLPMPTQADLEHVISVRVVDAAEDSVLAKLLAEGNANTKAILLALLGAPNDGDTKSRRARPVDAGVSAMGSGKAGGGLV